MALDFADDLFSSPLLSITRPEPAPLPPVSSLTPEEKESLLQKLASMGGSGLQFVGNVLGTLGRPVRTALAGRFEDVLPSIINPSRAASGEDLAKQWGLLQGEGTKGQFELRDLVGPAIEIATDPTTFFNPVGPLVGGSLTSAGRTAKLAGRLVKPIGATTEELAQAAKASGQLAPTLASRIAAGQGSLFGAGLPFAEPALNVGTGETAQKIAQSIGDVYGKIGASGPGRVVSALFDRRVQGTPDPFLQPVLRRADELTLPAAAEESKRVYGLARGLGDVASELEQYKGQLPAGFINSADDVLRGISEGSVSPIPGTRLGSTGQGIEEIGRVELPTRSTAKGLEAPVRAGYAPRSLNPVYKDDPGFRGPTSVAPQLPFQKSQLGREIPDEFVLGKTLGLNAMSRDPEIGGALRAGTADSEQIQAKILDKYMVLGGDEAAKAAKAAEAQKLTTFMGNLDPEKVKLGHSVYNPSFFGELETRLVSQAGVESKASAMLEGLRKAAVVEGPDTVPLKDVLKRAGFSESAMGSGIAAPGTPFSILPLHVPAEVADSVAKYATAFTRPDSVSPLIQGYDRLTQLFKTGVSTIFPASRVRDAWQNVFMNWVKGNRDTRFGALNPQSYIQPYADGVQTFRLGGVVKDATEIPAIKALGITDPETATKYIADQAAAFGLIKPGREAARSTAQLAATSTPEAAAKFVLPGTTKPFLKGITEGASLNPLNVRGGFTGATETTFLPAKVGTKAIEAIDDLGRGAAFYAQLRQGASFAEAARAAKEAMYDYSNLTKFEKSVMQRVIPFYSFMRQNLPAQLEELVKNPGGKLASTLKTTEALRSQQGFIPESVGEGLVVPVGTQDETGKQQYLTHFGLPFEEAFRDFNPSPVKSLQSLISQTNPLIKGPVELAAGKNLYTGNPLADQRPITGSVVLDQLIRNSPASRLVSQAQSLGGGDLVSLTGPLHVRSANVAGAENAAAKQTILDLLAGNPAIRKFENLSVKPEDLQTLTPRDRLLLELYRSLQGRRPQTVP